jgi:hypothetical protein
MDDIEDDVSALSFALSKDTSGRTTGTGTKRGGYIWDEWLDTAGSGIDSAVHTEGSAASEEPTYFSVLPSSSHSRVEESSSYAPETSRGGHSNTCDGTLETTIFELKDKVSMMKKEAKAKGLRSKQLQGECQRLKTAKNRKIQRCQTKWEEKLREEEEQQHVIISKQKDFIGKIGKDVSDLEAKMAEMQSRIEKASKEGKMELEIVKQEMTKQLARSRRQWELNEGAHFRKLLADKNDQLQQEVTDSFEPRLTRFVEKGRTVLKNKAADLEKKMQEMKRQLQSEMHGKLDDACAELREHLKREEQKNRLSGERDLTACLARHNAEVNALKERFAREKRTAEEGAEKLRRLESESTLDGLKTIRKAEQGKLQELAAQHAREMSELVSQMSAQREEHRRILESNFARWKATFTQRLDHELHAKADRMRGLAKAAAFSEGEEVIRKIKAELRTQNDELAEDNSSRLMEARLHHEEALKRLKHDEEHELGELDMLESDVRRLRMERDVARRDGDGRADKVAMAERRVESLRTELRAVQHELQALGLLHQQDSVQRMDALREELREWKDRYMDARDAAEHSSKRNRAATSDFKEKLGCDFGRITDKITAVLRSKDLVVRDLQRQLADLQHTNALRQDELELRRDRKFSSIDG